jgi:predicted kinase
MLIILRGIPGSGKSTLAKNIVKALEWDVATYRVASADNFFTDVLGNYSFDVRKLQEAHRKCRCDVLFALKHGLHAIVDNTHSRYWEFEEYLNMGSFAKVTTKVFRIDISHKRDIIACYDRCTHNVPLEKIAGIWIREQRYEGEIVIPFNVCDRDSKNDPIKYIKTIINFDKLIEEE